MVKADFINSYSTLLQETIQYACPRPQDYRKYCFLLNDKIKYDPCDSCNLPKAFFHLGTNFNSNCAIDQKHRIDLSRYSWILEVFKKNQDVNDFEESVKRFIQIENEERREAARMRASQPLTANNASGQNLSVDDLIRALSAQNAPKVKCPRWSSNIRIDNYIQSLEDWFLTCNIKNEITKYTLVLEAFKESENDSLKPLLDNFTSSVRHQIDGDDPLKCVSVLVPKFLREKFHLNTLTKSVETWKKLLCLEHDPNQTEIFISNLHALFEDCKQFNLTLTESQKAAFMLSKLNVDLNTYRNIVSYTEDLSDPTVFKTIESNVRRNCNLPAQVVSSINYMSYDNRSRQSRSRDRERGRSRDKSRSKSRHSQDRRNKSRSKSRDKFNQTNQRFQSYDNSRRGSESSVYRPREDREPSVNTLQASQSLPSLNDDISQSERTLEVEDTFISIDDSSQDLNFYKNFIIDTGAPSSIISFENARKIVTDFKRVGKPYKVEGTLKFFRFGPSKVFKSVQKITFPLIMYKAELNVSFFIVDAPNIPNLLGQDVLDRLKVTIDLAGRNLIFKSKEKNGQVLIPVRKLKSGHYSVPITLTNVYFLVRDGQLEPVTTRQHGLGQGSGGERHREERAPRVSFEHTFNVRDGGGGSGQESPEIQSKRALIIKIHRLTNHASPNQLWKFLKRAYQFTNGDKKFIFDTLSRCDVCSFHKKANPRSKVCLPRSLQVNEIVAIDTKDFKSKYGFYILYMIDVFSRLLMGIITPDKKPESCGELYLAWP